MRSCIEDEEVLFSRSLVLPPFWNFDLCAKNLSRLFLYAIIKSQVTEPEVCDITHDYGRS